MTRIVKARIPTHTCAQNRSASWGKPVTIPATGSAFHVVASCVVKLWVFGSNVTGKTLTPIVGRNADTKSTATMTHHVASGTFRPGSFASSERFEIVSIPVYVTIAIEMLARKLPHVGATPRW